MAKEESFSEQATFCSSHEKLFHLIVGNHAILKLSWCFSFKGNLNKKENVALIYNSNTWGPFKELRMTFIYQGSLPDLKHIPQ